MRKLKLSKLFIKDKDANKSKEKYRIRTEELNSGFIKYYPEYNDGALLSSFTPLCNFWCSLEKDAKLIIELHKESLKKDRELIIKSENIISL